ncbi:hypothetical protein DAPPUDRAFT_113155 [Daphnia pulex]|uniref:Uncharacterized protein n=1 Tax=Daphnia pulex TaxID=6669 RepID=E9HE91_DAPPU|nr:hypothetical protein DAPPUDRAFT_113155 [Daphnia pulex]|eukprot:EFX69939.1 hypothetical protein DAPPUDRAFT_113155 [Daphnia pulex]
MAMALFSFPKDGKLTGRGNPSYSTKASYVWRSRSFFVSLVSDVSNRMSFLLVGCWMTGACSLNFWISFCGGLCDRVVAIVVAISSRFYNGEVIENSPLVLTSEYLSSRWLPQTCEEMEDFRTCTTKAQRYSDGLDSDLVSDRFHSSDEVALGFPSRFLYYVKVVFEKQPACWISVLPFTYGIAAANILAVAYLKD